MMQVAINTIVSASVVLVIALGFSIVFSTARFFHFAHGIVFTSAAYFASLFAAGMNVPLLLAALLAVVCAGVIGWAIEIGVYRPLRRRGASGLILLLASLGTYIVLQNAISLVFGDATRTLRWGDVTEGIDLLGGRITPVQLLTILTSGVLTFLAAAFMKATKLGRTLRAVASDPDLAEASGIDSNRAILAAVVAGSFLAGIAGVLSSLLSDMTPTMGMTPLMLAVVAVVVGGVGSFPGLACAAVLTALAQQLTSWYFGAHWQDPAVFAILVAFLLFRPQGMLGRKVRKAVV